MAGTPKYRKYIASRDQRVDMDPIVPVPEAGRDYQVTARRKGGTAGLLTVTVRAESAEAAMQMVREGNAPGIGGGWIPVSVKEL